MKAIQFDTFGEPTDVLNVVDQPMPEPGPGEVRVRMILSPINPSDLLVTRGRYGVLPELPATPGFEGVGVVDAVGSGLASATMKRICGSKRVVVLNQAGGNWAEYAIVPALRIVPAPSDLPDEQIASFFVNPATAYAMTREVLNVPSGEWLLQSAANSALGRMIIRLGRHAGFRTINVVRRRGAAEEIADLKPNAVVVTEDGPIVDQVQQITGGRGVRFAIDPVGGAIGSDVFSCLDNDGRMLVYGLLSNEPIQFDPRAMIAGKRIIEGFWLGHFTQQQSKLKLLGLFRTLFGMIRDGVLDTPVGQTFPLDRIGEAVVEAERIGREGKTYLRCGSE